MSQHYSTAQYPKHTLSFLIPLHRPLNSVTYRIPDRLRQIVLTKGTDALEAAVELESAENLQQWAWYLGAYHQYHTAFQSLPVLYVRDRESRPIFSIAAPKIKA